MKDIKRKLILCIAGNFASLSLVVFAIILCDSQGPYWNIGPNNNLIVISVHIDSTIKYVSLLFVILFVNVAKVLSEEIGMPILGFNIYNPDKKTITEFTKNELQIYGNAMFMISSIRDIFMTLFVVSQIDIAVWSVLIREFASIFTIRLILNEKNFKSNNTEKKGYIELQQIIVQVE